MEHTGDSAGITPEALGVLVDNHARFLSFLKQRVGSADVAEELLQEAFVRALDRGEALRDDEAVTAWFYRLLRNALTDHYRRSGARRRAMDRAAAQPEPSGEGPDHELMNTVCDCVASLVETLKPEYGDILRRIDLDGHSIGAFATEHGITANNATVRLHRARKAALQQLARSCGTCATHGCLDCSCSA